jgi:hypothetical protein
MTAPVEKILIIGIVFFPDEAPGIKLHGIVFGHKDDGRRKEFEGGIKPEVINSVPRDEFSVI